MHEKLHFTDLPIVSWNIHGIFSRHSGFRYNKLHSPLFKSAIGNAKVLGRIETHLVSTEIDLTSCRYRGLSVIGRLFAL